MWTYTYWMFQSRADLNSIRFSYTAMVITCWGNEHPGQILCKHDNESLLQIVTLFLFLQLLWFPQLSIQLQGINVAAWNSLPFCS